MGGKLYGKLFAGFQIPDPDSGQADGFHIEFHGIDSFFMAYGNGFYRTAHIVITQDITQQMTLLVFPHGAGLVGFGGIACFADIQIGYHGIIGIGNRSGVSPGVFRIEEGIIHTSGKDAALLYNALPHKAWIPHRFPTSH